MPLKYCQYSVGSTSYSGRAYISGDGNSWIAGDPSWTTGQGRIVVNGSTAVVGNTTTQGVGYYYDAPFNVNGNFVYDVENVPSNPLNYSFSARTRFQGTLLTTAQGASSWVPLIQISADESTVAYNQTASSVVVKTWDGSSWIQKGSLISGRIIDISRNGNMISIRDGTPTKVYLWNGSSWQLLQSFTVPNTFIYFAASVDSLIVIEQNLQIRAYGLISGALQQIGGDIPVTGIPNARMSPDGTKIAFDPNIGYSLSGNTWNQISFSGSNFGGSYANFSLSNSRGIAQSSSDGGFLHFFELLTVPQVVSGQAFSGKVGQVFSAVTPQIIDGPSIYWNASGLPPGLSINQSTGLITGTPTTKGIYTSTISPSSESTTDYWRWGYSATVTFNIDDKDRLFYGSLANPNISFGNVGANMIYYGSQKIYPPTV